MSQSSPDRAGSTESARVSVVIRTKDRPLMLDRALSDVLAQTFSAWELVIVNDGGVPADVERVLTNRQSEVGDRVRVLHTTESGGRPAAANRGFDNVSGDYVVLHDDDDLWHPDFLKRTVDYLDAMPDAVAVTVPTEIVIEQADGEGFVEVDHQPFNPPGEVVTLFDLILINRIVPISMLIRSSTLNKIGGWDETLTCVGDWEFNLRLATTGQIGYLRGETLAFWTHRPDLVAGANANSIYASTDGHFEFDRLVRDRALSPDGPHHEIGQLLYLSKFIDERVRESEDRIIRRIGAGEDRLREQLHKRGARTETALRSDIVHHSFGATLRRVSHRLRRRSGTS